LRSTGLTISKTNYLIDLSKKYHEGIISDEILLKLSDEEISKKLCEIKGIGQVTIKNKF
jgi:DNA-3-methyladenine glycosylase II